MIKQIEPTEDLYRTEKDKCPLFFWKYKPKPSYFYYSTGQFNVAIGYEALYTTTAYTSSWIHGTA